MYIMTIKIAHRGYTNNQKDNSYAAIKEAIVNDFDMIEVDVQTNHENTLVLYHDIIHEELGVEISTLNDLDCLKQGILFLKSFLNIMRNCDKLIFLDLKSSKKTSLYLKILLLDNFDDLFSRLYISSFSFEHIECMFDLPVKHGYTTCNTFNVFDNHFMNKIYFICLDINIINEEFIEQCKKHGKQVFVFTCRNSYDKEYLEKFELDGIVTNILLS